MRNRESEILFRDKTPDEKKQRRRFSTLCGHVARRLKSDERLTGNVLECALDAAMDEKTAAKLRKGEPLSDYEKHLIVDVVLLRMRLG